MARVIRRLSEVVAQQRARRVQREEERRRAIRNGDVGGQNSEDRAAAAVTGSDDWNQDSGNREGEAGADNEAIGPRIAVA